MIEHRPISNRVHDAGHPAVAVILVNWNAWRHSIECVDSVLAQRYDNFHVFVVDNDSSDHSIEHIAAWCENPRADASWRRHEGVDRLTDRPNARPVEYRVRDRPSKQLDPVTDGCRVTLIRSGANLGFAGGCNVGLRAAGLDAFEFYWFLNTDTVVHREALTELVRRASKPTTGMTGSTLRYYSRPQIVQAFGGARMDSSTGCARRIGRDCGADTIPKDGSEVEKALSYIYGASMLVSNDFVRKIGPMQEDYFLYYEEADWALRGRNSFSLGYAPASHIFHKSGASSALTMPLLSLGYYCRNRIRFVCRFFPQNLPAAKRSLIWELLRYALRGRLDKARLLASVIQEVPQIEAEVRRAPRIVPADLCESSG